jgi:regulator of sigma E protease
MYDFLWNLVSFVVALGILVTVHEYGHFWVARKNGVKVERFSVGFGRAIWRKVGIDGTEYVLAMIPLGGYVKMLDERVDNVLPEDKDKTFNSKSVYQRIAIVGAGPLANFIFALFALYLMFLIGVPSVKPIVGEISTGSIADLAGLGANTEIVSIDGKTTRDWQEVNLALISQVGNKNIEVKAKVNDSQYVKSFNLNVSNWTFSPSETPALTSLGIIPFRPKIHNKLAVLAKDSPAAKSGLLVGDEFLAINGKKTEDWQTFAKEIKRFPEQEVLITIQRGLNTLSLPLTPNSVQQDGTTVGYIGVGPKVDEWPKDFLIELTYGPVDAILEGAQRTWDLTSLTFSMIGKLITGDVSVKNLSGPIGIAQGAGSSAGHGFVYFLGFLALISINLGIINLLPLPVLDGGHLLYYLIELFTGKEVPVNVQEAGFKFGALALLMLMSIGLINDFSRIFS